MSFITLSNSSKQIDDFFNMKEEHVDLFDNDEFALNDPFQEYYFGDCKKMDKINDNLIQSDDLHNTFNILQHEMGYLVCAPEIAQDSCAICKKNICICFDGLEKQNNELIRDFAAEYTDIRNNFCTNNDDDNINNFEKPQQNIKLKVPIVEFDYKFEEKNIGSTLNTSVKDFSAKSISCGKLRDEIKQESIENESYDESQNLDMNIKSNKTKSKIDSNLFLVRRACFRGFSEYYKNLFARANYSWQRKRGNKKKKTPMMTLIREFAESEFGDLISKLTESQWNKFRTTLFTILFSHRYKKDDEFLKGIDFTQVRSVLYHYTTEARVDFLKNPQFCYLIHHFYLKNRGQFLQSKKDDGRKLSIIELDTELSILHEESLTTLQRQSPF